MLTMLIPFAPCIFQVTWVVNSEYNETTVPQLYHPLLRSGQALGARHWLASLQRCCEYLTILRSDPVPSLTSPCESLTTREK